MYLEMAKKHFKKNDELRKQAMFPEMKSLDDMGCWDVMDVKDMPKGAKLVSGRWVFVQKYDEKGDPTRKKGRYVARGFSQREGIDYSANHTYAPVASPDVIRLALQFGAHQHMHMHQIDIGNAYILSPLEHEIWMKPPLGLKEY